MKVKEKIEYIANDGRCFSNKDKCINYEKEIESKNQEEIRIKKFKEDIGKYELDINLPPLNADAGAFSDLSTYHWMEVKNKNEYKKLKKLLKDENLKEPIKYPYYYCSEEMYDEEFIKQTEYNYTIDDVIEWTRNFYEMFGYEINIERRK